MKLLYCNKCSDIFLLVKRVRTCYCGASRGWYTDELHAKYAGDCVPIGIHTGDFKKALKNQSEEGYVGVKFEAFVVPKKCDTFVGEEI